jgi:DNA polymerase-1
MLVFDGHLALHRCLHVPEFASMSRQSDGMPTGGVFNVLSVVARTLETYKDDKCIVVFDGDRSPRRKALYPGYKDRSAKQRTPDDVADGERHTALFKFQLSILERALPLFGVRVVRVMTKEGDDVVAHVARSWQHLRHVYVVSDDKDMWQLVNANISIYRPGAAYAGRADSFVNEANFRVVSGVSSPQRFLLRKALVGDDSDLIDGVDGIGEKTATEFVEHVGSEFIRQAPGAQVAEQVATIAAADTSKRVRRLSEDAAKKIVERNLELMDLSREQWTDEEKAQVQAAVWDGHAEVRRVEAMSLCQKLEFQSILERWSYFMTPFNYLR